jgi:DNA-3-methyladenine glycosylase I
MSVSAGAERGPDGKPRCGWAIGTPDYLEYHDNEWGRPLHGEVELFERLTLEAFQSGLSWLTILNKREAFREAFADFDPAKVAAFGPADRERLMADAGIVRSNAKIDAAINGARIYMDMQAKGEDFAQWLWSFVGGKPIQYGRKPNEPARVDSPESIAMSKALKAKGFKFVGPVIVYAFMQAVGMVNDHHTGCFRHDPIKAMG